MNIIIIDLEATCTETNENFDKEIIEIGAVKLNLNGDTISEFNSFVKPINNPTLSEFCKNLTSITQSDVDSAKPFLEVVAEFVNWLGDEDFLILHWGSWDSRQMDKESNGCVPYKWNDKSLNLKLEYSKTISNSKKRRGMKKVLLAEGFELSGTHHRGIDDARNLSKIFIKHLDKWQFLIR